MKRSSRILALVVLMLGFLAISNGLKAQNNVAREGNKFIVQGATTERGTATKTKYTLETRKSDGTVVVDTIYLSANGSAFVWKVSKKTGKTYRKYLPEITKQLGTKKGKK